MTTIREVCLCPHCYTVHGTREEAVECCVVDPIHCYQCVQCDDVWGVEENAKECCT